MDNYNVKEDYNIIYNQAITDCYNNIVELFNMLAKINNRDFENAKSEQYKYDLTRDANTLNRDFNMALDRILRLKVEDKCVNERGN